MFKFIRFYLKNYDIFLIWLTLLLFNIKIGSIYVINCVTVVLFIYLIFKNKYNKITLIYFIVIFIFSIVGFIISNFYFEPFKYIFNYFQIFIYFNYFNLRIINKGIIEKNKIIKSLEILTILYLFLGFIEFETGTILWFESRNYDSFLPRINLGFGDSNSLAAFLILFSSMIFEYKLIKKSFVFIIGILTFSRSFLIAFIFIFLIQAKKSIFKILLVCVLFYIMFIYFSISEDYSFALDRLNETNSEDNPRLVEWSAAINNISIYPNWNIFKFSLDPHNSFLLALNLVGPIGVFFVFHLLYMKFKHFFKFHNNENISVILYGFLVFCFFNSELFSIRNTASLGMILGVLNSKFNENTFNRM